MSESEVCSAYPRAVWSVIRSLIGYYCSTSNNDDNSIMPSWGKQSRVSYQGWIKLILRGMFGVLASVLRWRSAACLVRLIRILILMIIIINDIIIIMISMYIYIYIYIHTCNHTTCVNDSNYTLCYIYIYIHREREREREIYTLIMIISVFGELRIRLTVVSCSVRQHTQKLVWRLAERAFLCSASL